MNKISNDYDFELIVSEEKFKENQKKYVDQSLLKKYKFKKWVRCLLTILVVSIIVFVLIFLLLQNEKEFDKYANKCDQEKGYTCSYYEVRQYILNKQ